VAFKLNGGYPIIYTDNPWKFDNAQSHDPARGGTPYKQMSLQELCDMGPLIQAVAHEDCALFMWASLTKIPEALECMDAWGFGPVVTTPFVWVKLNPTGSIEQQGRDIILKNGLRSGQGYWTNTNAEIVLLGRRGKPKRVRKDIKQIVLAPVGDHSAKPPEVAERIKQLMGEDLPGLELFARPPARVKGWTRRGFEISGTDIRDDLREMIG
jgi:N6-adenosine-specific RNA methylase IME4